MFDWRIRQARVLDGSGSRWFRGDVGISDGRIMAVGDLTGAPARREVDAEDLCLAPGFVDAHTHSDFTLPRFPRGESSISQGVTTEVGGNCGLSPFPVDQARLDLVNQSIFFMGADLAWEWRSTEDFLATLESLPLSHNFLPLVGHGALRVAAMGFERRPPDDKEMDEMKRLVAEAMEAGVAGLSSGLTYSPGCFVGIEELIELCRVVGCYGGIFAAHLRDEADGLLGAVREALSIGQRAAVPVQLSHHKAVGRANRGRVRQSLALVDEARQRGQDVSLDQCPYMGSSTNFTALLPEWAMEGGVAAPDLLQAEGEPSSTIMFGASEEDVEQVMRHPQAMVGSDGYCISPTTGSRPHPRNYGTFPRVLARYVREKGVLSLEEAVRKMTSLPAHRFGLWDRGVIRPGYVADLVLFDASRIEDTATHSDPHQYAAGIEWTMVRGEVVWEEGRDTGVEAGQLLRHRPPRTAA
ncbi:MAG: N-acyl-D-amino-acid deacylase family protein [Chloroflexota bacterium]